MKRTLTAALGLAAMAAAPMMTARPAQAEIIQLGFILDESGSIGSSNYTIIKNGLATAIGNIPTTGTNQYEVSVVSFASGATVLVAPTIVTAASIAGIQAAITGDGHTGGQTDYNAAFTLMTSTLTGSTNFSASGKSYVNFATDGDPTDGGTFIPFVTDNQAGINARNAMIAAGIDNISIEGIGSVDANNLKTNYCYPGPCDDTVPFDFPVHGFYLGVADATAYANAIAGKIQLVTCTTNCGPLGENPIPEPASLAVFGLGLLGIGLATRRRNRIH